MTTETHKRHFISPTTKQKKPSDLTKEAKEPGKEGVFFSRREIPGRRRQAGGNEEARACGRLPRETKGHLAAPRAHRAAGPSTPPTSLHLLQGRPWSEPLRGSARNEDESRGRPGALTRLWQSEARGMFCKEEDSAAPPPQGDAGINKRFRAPAERATQRNRRELPLRLSP